MVKAEKTKSGSELSPSVVVARHVYLLFFYKVLKILRMPEYFSSPRAFISTLCDSTSFEEIANPAAFVLLHLTRIKPKVPLPANPFHGRARRYEGALLLRYTREQGLISVFGLSTLTNIFHNIGRNKSAIFAVHNMDSAIFVLTWGRYRYRKSRS